MATELGQAYVQIIPSAKGISGAIRSQLDPEASAAGTSAGESLAGRLVSVVKGVIATAAIGKAFSAALTEGANLEQSLGGIETLFKGSADKVKKYADEAYRTSGLSANDYMENVTSFSASLLQSVGGDTEKAADVANMAMIDMSDNANKMGTNMQDIQNAYQGFAKQNYTMLDNLKLGYGGTKEEMQRLLADAEKLTGVKYDISNLSDVYNAIHAIQENLDITGTTALEAAETFSGSFAAMKAAASNVLGKMALGQDIQPSLNQLAETTSTFLVGNFIPMVANILKALPGAVVTFIKAAIPHVKQAFSELFGSIGENVASDFLLNIGYAFPIIQADLNNFMQQIKDRLPELGDAFNALVTGLSPVLAMLGGIITTWGTAISAVLTNVIPLAVDVLRIAFEGIAEFILPVIELVLRIFWDLSAAITSTVYQYIVPALKQMVEWVRSNESVVKALTAVLAGALAGFLAFKAITTVFNSVRTAVLGVKTAFVLMKAAMVANPFGVVLAAAGALAAGLAYLYKTNENVRNSVTNVVSRVKELTSNFMQSDVVTKTLAKGMELVSSIGNTVANVLGNIGSKSASAAGSIDWVGLAFSGLKAVAMALMGPIGLVIKAFELMAKSIGGGEVKQGFDTLMSSFDGLTKGIQQNAPMLGQSIGQGLQGILTAIGQALPGIIAGGLQIVAGVISGIAQGLPSLTLAAAQLITSFTGAMMILIPTIALSATQIIVAFLGAMTMALPQVIAAGARLINTLLQGITEQLPMLVENTAQLILTWLTALNEQMPQILQAGFTLLTTFLQGIANNIGQVTQQALNIVLNFAQVIVQNMPTIVNTAVDLMVNFVNALASRMPDIVNSAVNLIASFINGIANNLGLIIDAAMNLMVQFLEGIARKIPDVINAAMNLVDSMVQGVLQVQGRLMDAAITLINGFADNIRNRQEDMRSAAMNLLDAIIGVFVPDSLWNAGVAIIDGFLGGLQSGFEEVKGFVGGIADWIAENKGPISYDRKLLIPAGNAIMDGLNAGLSDSFSNVKGTIATMANEIQGIIDDGIDTNRLTNDAWNPQVAYAISAQNTAVKKLSGIEATNIGMNQLSQNDKPVELVLKVGDQVIDRLFTTFNEWQGKEINIQGQF